MANELSVFLYSNNMPTYQRWNLAFAKNDIDFKFLRKFDPKKHFGTTRCFFGGEVASFEYSYEKIGFEILDCLSKAEKKRLAGRDVLITFTTRSSEKDYISSIIASSVLIAVSSGLELDENLNEKNSVRYAKKQIKSYQKEKNNPNQYLDLSSIAESVLKEIGGNTVKIENFVIEGLKKLPGRVVPYIHSPQATQIFLTFTRDSTLSAMLWDIKRDGKKIVSTNKLVEKSELTTEDLAFVYDSVQDFNRGVRNKKILSAKLTQKKTIKIKFENNYELSLYAYCDEPWRFVYKCVANYFSEKFYQEWSIAGRDDKIPETL